MARVARVGAGRAKSPLTASQELCWNIHSGTINFHLTNQLWQSDVKLDEKLKLWSEWKGLQQRPRFCVES
jgi:hypothetical protein